MRRSCCYSFSPFFTNSGTMNLTALLPIIGVTNFCLKGKLSFGRSLESCFVFVFVFCFFSFVHIQTKKVLNIEKEKQNKNKFAKMYKYFMKQTKQNKTKQKNPKPSLMYIL